MKQLVRKEFQVPRPFIISHLFHAFYCIPMHFVREKSTVYLSRWKIDNVCRILKQWKKSFLGFRATYFYKMFPVEMIQFMWAFTIPFPKKVQCEMKEKIHFLTLVRGSKFQTNENYVFANPILHLSVRECIELY